MPVLPSRRPPLCLICAFVQRARPQRRLLPLVQTAQRSTQGSRKYRSGREEQEDTRADSTKFRYAFKRTNLLNVNDAVQRPLQRLRETLETSEFLDSIQLSREKFEEGWTQFVRTIRTWINRAQPEAEALLQGRSQARLMHHLRYLWYNQTFSSRFTEAELENQKALANLCYPAEWYPATRELNRTIHLHVGPTNSGKTYRALKRLEEAKSGIYLGPLRLLAHEVYTRLNAKGRACALVTGEEQRMPPNTDEERVDMFSCTVEMAPLSRNFDVAVIDEIQMINHKDRGWAWTQAFLGILAKEVHLCGEARTVSIIKELCALVGDKVVVHEYERLSPLKVANKSLGGRIKGNLEKGDCIVSFSVLGIHALRKTVEQSTGRKCAIVYGSLPPETRAQQARLFNDPDNDHDFLVASDAIGMGLNLSIKRVIFETTMKNNGHQLVPLAISEVKQIAGRAGRYRTAHQAVAQDGAAKAATEAGAVSAVEPAVAEGQPTAPAKQAAAESIGYATTLDSYDYRYLAHCMETEAEPIATAGVFPPAIVVERFAQYFPPNTPFSYILQRLHEISKLHPRFYLCALKDQVGIAECIRPVKNLSIQERLVICAAPTNVKEDMEQEFMRTLATCIAENKEGALLNLPIPLETLDEPPTAERSYLYNLEQLHKMLVLYLWMSYRFPNIFTTRALANYAKKLVEDKIDTTLEQFSHTEQRLKKIKQRREEAMKRFESAAETPEKAEEAVEKVAESDREVEYDDGDEFPTLELDDEEPGPSTVFREVQADTVTQGSRNGSAQGDEPGFIPEERSQTTDARI